jgi:hypothetical protein
MCIRTTIPIHRNIDYVQIDEIPSTKSLKKEIRECRLCTHSNVRTTNTAVLFFLQCRQRINFRFKEQRFTFFLLFLLIYIFDHIGEKND